MGEGRPTFDGDIADALSVALEAHLEAIHALGGAVIAMIQAGHKEAPGLAAVAESTKAAHAAVGVLCADLAGCGVISTCDLMRLARVDETAGSRMADEMDKALARARCGND